MKKKLDDISSVYELCEEDVDIKKRRYDDALVQLLWSKKSLQAKQRIDYWSPAISRGQKLFDYYNGNILDDATRRIYEESEDKIIIEPRTMRGPIRALHGQTVNGIRSGSVTTEGGNMDGPAASAEEVSVMNAVLTHLEQKGKVREKVSDAIHDSYVSCYPNVLYWEKVSPSCRGNVVNGYRLTKLPWNSCCFGPVTFKEVDGSDIRDLLFFDWRTQGELLDNFPMMKEQIQSHFSQWKQPDSNKITSLAEWDGMVSSEQREILNSIADQAVDGVTGPTGMTPVFQHLFPIKKLEDVWLNVMSDDEDDFVVKPPEWGEERWNNWQESNPDYQGPFEREVISLWYTVWTGSGIVLANERHWFQDRGRLPAGFIIPAIIAGVPSGPADDMADDTLAKCIGEIEYLDEVRKNSGRFFATIDGAIINPEDFIEEASRNVGMISIDAQVASQHGGIQGVLQEYARNPNQAFKQWGDNRQTEMYEQTRINETMQGQTAPRQSDVAKQTEIAQGLIVNAIYITSINRGYEEFQNLNTALVPYIYSEEDYLEIDDAESGEQVGFEVNKPTEFDAEGNPVEILNDLTAHRFKWRMSQVDNSPTAKQRQMQEAILIINSTGGPLLKADPTGKFFADFLQSMPNEMLKDAGKRMAEDVGAAQQAQSQAQQMQTLAEAQMEMKKLMVELTKANKQGLSLSFSAADLAQYPQLQQFYLQLQQNAAMQTQQQMAEGQQQPQQQQMQMPQEAGVI